MGARRKCRCLASEGAFSSLGGFLVSVSGNQLQSQRLSFLSDIFLDRNSVQALDSSFVQSDRAGGTGKKPGLMKLGFA